jgi:acyl-CoA thioester hydrolase/thioesterase-3
MSETEHKEPGSTSMGRPIVFETRHRVQFREIDAYGHMNMLHYLTYFSDHRFEGMRRFIGLGLQEIDDLPIAFHVRHVEIDYQRPVLRDQEFVIRSHMAEIGRAQCYVALDMSDAEGQRLATCRMRIGCIDRTTQRPCAWPAGLMERFHQ